MIPTSQFNAFSLELQKEAAHPYVHAATGTAGAALAAKLIAPYLYREHERDLRDEHMGEMSKDVRKMRDRRRLAQFLLATTGGAGLGAATPLAVEHGAQLAAEKWRAARTEAADTAQDLGARAAQGARETWNDSGDDIADVVGKAGRRAADSVADAFKERAADIGEEATRGARKGLFSGLFSRGK